jgi:hypothetical protein
MRMNVVEKSDRDEATVNGDPTNTEPEKPDPTERRLEAERRKLELEAIEIERRLNAHWWQSERLPQFAVAAVITASLLFGWVKVYLEPIIRREGEITELAERRDRARNELLEAESAKLAAERAELVAEKARLAAERDRLSAANTMLNLEKVDLSTERDALASEKRALQLQFDGIKVNLARVLEGKDNSRLFAIVDHGPINDLGLRYGWEVWSDDNFSELAYYLRITHKGVNHGKQVIVARSFELDQLKKKRPEKWRDYLDNVNTVPWGGPVLILDVSYFGLYADPNASVGCTIYRKGSKDTGFYAPLPEWSTKLAAVLGD